MSTVVVDDRFRVQLKAEVRKRFSVEKGDELLLVAASDEIIIKKVPKDLFRALSEVIGGVKFDREARRRAEKWLLSRASGS